MPRSGLLADKLIGVVDDIRRKVHGALGTLPYVVSIVTRRWSGGRLGVGTYVDSRVELDPQPRVKCSLSVHTAPGGSESGGGAILTGVSLRYTEAEIWGKGVGGDSEQVWMLEEAHSQGQAPTYYTVASATPRRGSNAGDATDWLVELAVVQDFAPYNGTDA